MVIMKGLKFKLVVIDDENGEELISEVLRDTWEIDIKSLKTNEEYQNEACDVLVDYVKNNITKDFMIELVKQIKES